ncbi:MAG TPA: hypothetical protein PKC67_01625 [Kiritimatiellia bacterium]|nr:hypothetical protein [Kiritimatiellia bacterium]HMP33022.1 hypothetical protein [Kiritimatiellia bacterium]
MARVNLILSSISLFLAIGVTQVRANTVFIHPVPVLHAALPTGTTHQVELSTNGIGWTPSGVLVAGSGTTNSVRLDVLPANVQFRYVLVGATSVVFPAVSTTLSLSNYFKSAVEVHIQTTTSLVQHSWTLRRITFPDLNGHFLHAFRFPTQQVEAIRAYEPGNPMVLATVANYSPNPSGASLGGFGPVADDMPPLYRDGFMATACDWFFHRDGTNAAAAGECYEFAGPLGLTTVMVSDVAFAPTGTCASGRSYFDIGQAAYTNLFAESGGYGTATYRLVPAPVTGSVKMFVASAGLFTFSLTPYNHRAGVRSLEVQFAGGTWSNLPRSLGNRFDYVGLYTGFPMQVRITSRFGEVVTFPPINVITTGARYVASSQFAVFPDLETKPEWILSPIYVNDFSRILGDRWSVTPFGGVAFNPTNPGAAFQGSAGLSITNLATSSGFILGAPRRFSTPPDGLLEFAVRSGTTGVLDNVNLRVDGFTSTGTSTNSSLIRLPTITTNWQVLRIPLEPARTPPRIGSIFVINHSASSSASLRLDSIFFRQP